MAVRPSLNIAVAGTKNQASKYNQNFDLMMDFVDDSINEAKTYVNGYMPEIDASTDGKILTNNGSVASWTTFSTLLQTIYPVGAIFIGTTSTCPLAALFGTWEKVAADRCLQGSSENHAANTTIAAKIPNITGKYGQPNYQTNPTKSGACGGSSSQSGTGTTQGGYRAYTVNFDASLSNSTYSGSTLQPSAYVVNVWKRTA